MTKLLLLVNHNNYICHFTQVSFKTITESNTGNLIPVHNILKLCNILENFRSTTSKTILDIQYKKHC